MIRSCTIDSCDLIILKFLHTTKAYSIELCDFGNKIWSSKVNVDFFDMFIKKKKKNQLFSFFSHF